VKIKFVHLFLL